MELVEEPIVLHRVFRFILEHPANAVTALAAYRAPKALIEEIKKNGLDAYGFAAGEDIPPGVLGIRVRLKPMPGEPKGNLILLSPKH